MPNHTKPNRVILSVYFSGSSHSIDNISTLGGTLFNETIVDNQIHFKMGFSGCEVEHGILGTVFGKGIEQQCQQVHSKIIELLKQNQRIQVNIYGHSRGGIAGYMLALVLRHYPRNLVKVNLAILDPVPGNYVITFHLDFFKISLAAQTFDLTQCNNLRNVLVIYTNIIVSTLLPYAPLLPKYPSTCKVTEEIIHGNHSEAQIISGKKLDGQNYESRITFNLITRFLREMGNQFSFFQNIDTDFSNTQADVNLADSFYYCYGYYSSPSSTPIQRISHSKPLTYIKTTPNAFYLSPTHERANQKKQSTSHHKIEHNRYTFSFDPPREHLTPKKRDNKIEDNVAAFKEFLEELTNCMSNDSKKTDKFVFLQKIKDEFTQDKMPSHEFKDLLRNVLAICLQRNKYAYSLFTTTTTGHNAVKLLNSKKYQSIAEIIKPQDKHPIRYRDLRYYILGENKANYFNAKNASSLYEYFKTTKAETNENHPTSKLFANNIGFYLSR